jgi:alkanesulfonate monooxygenase SsuD/methylene tetrahydromethanopterin reductase-like flavin-dependent oxidoreductase (luciferase family)
LRFSNFLFPESRDPDRDGAVIREVMREVRLSEDLGIDTLWLSEHHFDGNCAYVDPMTFGAAIAACTRRIRIGFAVAQTSLHHPIRLAEQFALIDHLSQGRLIIGLGRGTNYNIYEYQGYGIDPNEAQARFEESVDIMLRAWTSEHGFTHQGRFWDLNVPVLRPRPFTRPHPPTIRAASGAATMLELGAHGLPFLMNVQSLENTNARIAAWREAARAHGVAEEAIAKALDQSWIWRNVFVADTDAEAERIGLPAFAAMQRHRSAMRERVLREQGATMVAPAVKPPERIDPSHALLCGAPATVAEQIARLEATGVGGVILTFRMGPMHYEQVASSMTLFMEKVVPTASMRQAA